MGLQVVAGPWWVLLPTALAFLTAAPDLTVAAGSTGGNGGSAGTGTAGPEDIPIGTIFSMWADYNDVFTAMQYALERQYNDSRHNFQFKLYADKIKTVDAFKLTRIICRQFERGIYALMGTVDPESFDTLNSYANAFEMPFVTPWFPESVYQGPKDWKQEFAIQIRPEYNQAISDLILYYGWQNVIYIYNDFDGLLRLQRIYKTIPRTTFGGYKYKVDHVRQVQTSAEAVDFLLDLEKADRNSVKHVVLDCPSNMAKEILVEHVRNVHLGRRNFHYLMSGLVLDDEWDSQVAEYGAINVTGLRIVPENSEVAQTFFRLWRRLDRKKYKAAGVDGISASGALAYDAVNVFEAAFRTLLAEKPFLFRHDRLRGALSTTCNMTSDGRQQPWKHGAAIAKALKSVQMEGLTGHISFNDEGRRVNYSFDVVEMSPGSKLGKVGTWSDTRGLQITVGSDNSNPFSGGRRPPSRPSNPRGKTYRLTSILEKPYLMLKEQVLGSDGQSLTGNSQYEGYCKDLADLISMETGASFEIKPVADGKYGALDPTVSGGWNGMIGELVRGDADIAVGPLTITAERELVVDFTQSFMSAGVSIMMKRPASRFQRPGLATFLSPLSMEIWICTIFSFIGVSIVTFIVSRFSPSEWTIRPEAAVPVNTAGGGGARIRNNFTLANSIWFTFGSLMHQDSNGFSVGPKSLAGRVVGASWWFFAFIFVASYTANLAAFLTVDRLASPVSSADDLARQTEIEYGAVEDGTTLEFFAKSHIPVYSRMHEFMTIRKPYVLVNSTQEGIDRVRNSGGGYAFLLESPTNEYANLQFPCDTMKVGGREGRNLDAGRGYGVATSKQSDLRDAVNKAILKLVESGHLAMLKNKWWYDLAQCPLENSGSSGSLKGKGFSGTEAEAAKSELSLSSLSGVFLLLIFGLVLGIILAALDLCLKSRKESRRGKVNLSETMKTKAKLAIQGGREVDSMRFYGADSSAL